MRDLYRFSGRTLVQWRAERNSGALIYIVRTGWPIVIGFFITSCGYVFMSSIISDSPHPGVSFGGILLATAGSVLAAIIMGSVNWLITDCRYLQEPAEAQEKTDGTGNGNVI